MSELFFQLGIDWRLFLSQAANFLILLLVLRMFAYKPLMKMLEERRARIEEGLTHADEADRRLAASNDVMKQKMKEAEHEAVAMMQRAETRAKGREAEMMELAKKKEETMMAQAERMIEAKAEDMRKNVEAEAAELVKEAIVRTVQMKPEAVDEALIAQALASVKHTK
jgi:F-type H+-transporting ATPase subunit b